MIYYERPYIGIIPAYAGSTCAFLSLRDARGDHPRIRGEHLVVGNGARLREGIIPAYAGSTGVEVRVERVSQGSSPHTRGAHPNSLRK